MDSLIWTLVLAIAILAAVSVAGYFILRKLFLRAAETMSSHIARVLGQLADVAGDRLTHLGAYAFAQGMTEDAARAQFSRSIERTARIMDSAVKLPIIGGVGLDALLGLFPVAGDTVSAIVSLRLIAKSIRYGIPREIITKMLANVIVDLLIGAVPLIGDIADAWFKANERNVALLKEYLGDEARDVIVAEVVKPSA